MIIRYKMFINYNFLKDKHLHNYCIYENLKYNNNKF